MPSTKRFGSKVGVDTSASTPPVDGSMATSAPRRSPKAFSAISCSFDVERQREVAAGNGRGAGETAYGAAAGVDFDLFVTGYAMQREFVGLFDPRLADVLGSLVVGLFALLFDGFEVALVDPVDVTERVRGDGAERILAEQPRFDFDAREAIAVGGEFGDLFVGEAGADRQALERFVFLK